MDQDLERYKEARRVIEKARAARIFLSHFVAFVIGNGFLGLWNALTYFVKDDTTLWFYIPLLFWGVAVIIHYTIAVALFDDWWELDEGSIDRRRVG